MLGRLYSTKTRGKTRVWWNPSLVPRPLTSKTLFLCCSFLHGLLVALCPFSYVHSPIVKVNSDSDVFWCNLSVGSEVKCASFCKVSLAVEYDVWLKVIWSGRFSYGDYCKNNINVCVTMMAKSIFTHASISPLPLREHSGHHPRDDHFGSSHHMGLIWSTSHEVRKTSG